jgi:hypothetical protein
MSKLSYPFSVLGTLLVRVNEGQVWSRPLILEIGSLTLLLATLAPRN